MKLSVVTTLYYSQPYISEFYLRIIKSIQGITADYEIIFVNDGSPDNSLQEALELLKINCNVIIIDLSRNFGHHRAIMTGLAHARGEYVFLIDSDLEEDPEVLTIFWEEMGKESSIDVLYGVQEKRKGGWFEKIAGSIYYLLFSKLSDIEYPKNTLTARLMKFRFVENVLRFKETELDIWGIFVLAGFTQKPIYLKKSHKGASTYTLKRKLKMAIDSITSFSSRPLIYIFFMGAIITVIALVIIFFVIIQKIFFDVSIEGWTSLLISIWLIGGILIFCIGVIGIYLSKMFLEVKQRPNSIIRTIYKYGN